MPPDQLPVLLREFDQPVGARPVERALGGLDHLPLHLIARSDDRELAADDGLVVGMIQIERYDRGTYAEAVLRGQRSQGVRRDPVGLARAERRPAAVLMPSVAAKPAAPTAIRRRSLIESLLSAK